MIKMNGNFLSFFASLIVNTHLQARLCPPLQHHRQAAQEEGAEQEPLPVQQPQPPLQVSRVGLLKGFLRLCATEAVPGRFGQGERMDGYAKEGWGACYMQLL